METLDSTRCHVIIKDLFNEGPKIKIPLFYRSLYMVVILVVLPLLVVNLWKNNAQYDIKFDVWIIGGLFTMMAVPISLWDITQHLVHFNKPHMQKYIIR